MCLKNCIGDMMVVSGGFDPLHSGHIAYLKSAKEQVNQLVVLLNSDDWLARKKGRHFMSFKERKCILSHLEIVDDVIEFDDSDGTACDGLEIVKRNNPDANVIFCNGGDRTIENIPEMSVRDVEFRFGVGGDDKKNSSSWILKDFQYRKEERCWGEFYDLFQDPNVKVKELIVAPGQGMSYQKHKHRGEVWVVSKGKCDINYSDTSPEPVLTHTLEKYESWTVHRGSWHQITNPYDEECRIVEIQYGEVLSEDDIERLRYYEPV